MLIKRWTHSIRHFFRHKAIVLMYHRIADIDTDPWQLAVSPANFGEQLQVLHKYRVIPARQLTDYVQHNRIPANCICLTFDDGYADNYYAAIPLLERYECQASFFIATAYIGRQQAFWWDELEDIFLHTPQLPPVLALTINDNLLQVTLNNNGILSLNELQLHRQWQWPAPPPTGRCELYLLIWEHLKPLSYQQQQAAMVQLRHWAGSSPVRDTRHLPMTETQLDMASRHPLVDIGLHTCTHASLAAHDSRMQQHEIQACEQYLETHTTRHQPLISYPYGGYNDHTIAVIKEQGLAGAFTTEAQAVTSNTDILRLGRFQVKNWDGETFEKQLSDWIKRF